MAGTATPAGSGAVRVEAGAPGLRARPFVLLVAAGAALAVALLGWFLGAASLTGVEPNAAFVSCGPALFGRPDQLPDALCADAYRPLVAISVMLITAGVLGAVLCLGLVIRSATASGRSA